MKRSSKSARVILSSERETDRRNLTSHKRCHSIRHQFRYDFSTLVCILTELHNLRTTIHHSAETSRSVTFLPNFYTPSPSPPPRSYKSGHERSFTKSNFPFSLCSLSNTRVPGTDDTRNIIFVQAGKVRIGKYTFPASFHPAYYDRIERAREYLCASVEKRDERTQVDNNTLNFFFFSTFNTAAVPTSVD